MADEITTPKPPLSAEVIEFRLRAKALAKAEGKEWVVLSKEERLAYKKVARLAIKKDARIAAKKAEKAQAV